MNYLFADDLFTEVSKEEFDYLLEGVPYKRNNWCDGEVYVHMRGRGEDLGFLTRDGRYMINPKFFKPSQSTENK